MGKTEKLLLFFIITFILVPFLLNPATAFAQPKIYIPEEGYDFGSVEEGVSLEHYFEVVNTGTERLLIKEVVPSWGCTAVLASSASLAPGEKGGINVKVETRGKRGQVQKNVRVITNDPVNPQVTLSIRFSVKKESQ